MYVCHHMNTFCCHRTGWRRSTCSVTGGHSVTPQSSILAFILLFLIYIVIMASNLGLVVLITMEKSLHQAMYLLFWAWAWASTVAFFLLLLGLTICLSHYRVVISHWFCDNAFLLKLSLYIYIYGLSSAIATMGVSFTCMLLTYLRIAVMSLNSNNKALNSKVLQTCVYICVYIFLCATLQV